MAGDPGGGGMSPKEAPCAGEWETEQKLSLVHVAHALGFRPPDLVLGLVGGQCSSLCRRCHSTRPLNGCFNRTPLLCTLKKKSLKAA